MVLATGQYRLNNNINMQVEQLFRLASNHFEDTNYEQGLELMSKCIQSSPTNSALYSNRALFHSQLGNIDAAVDDLTVSINYNYLNYVAYFNLFSLQFKAGQIFTAFDNLCCSLSSLYLVRARKARRELDVQRSIKYAQNNPQAHILKALMYLEDGKNKLALNQIQWALDIQIHTALCIKIKNIINRKLNPYSISQINDNIIDKENFRLHTSYQPAEDYDIQIKQRVHQFNQIYDELVNSQYGTITQKVPRIILENDNSNVNKSQSKLIGEISQIYQIRYRDVNLNKQSKEKSSEAATKEHLPNQYNESDLLFQRQTEDHEQVLPHQSENVEQKHLDEDNLLDDDSLNKMQEQFKKEPILAEQQDNLLLQNQKEQLVPAQQPLLQEQNLLTPIEEAAPLTTTSKSFASSTSETVSLYPIGAKKKLQFTIISAEVKNTAKLKDLYLTGNYNSRKGQRIKTPNKKIQGSIVKWFTSIAATPISQTMQTVNVKVFNKQYFSYDDDLIGEGQVQIIKSGQMRFPIYFKNKITGYVNMRVDLV